MKKITSILLFLSALLYVSCDALDLSPEDYYGSGNFWTKEAQVEGYMNGLHNNLRSSYTMFYVLGEARGGTSRYGTSSLGTSMSYSDPIKNNMLTKDNTGISNWYDLYGRIMQVNHFISEVSNGCSFLSESKKGFYLGRAYGLRALYYFMLYKTYGGVPLITDVKVLEGGKISADALYTERSTPETILKFIKSDLEASELNFGNNVTIDRAMWTKYATLMLKAEVYMWSAKVTTGDHQATGNSDLAIAQTALQPLINQFSLLDNFSEVFSKKANDEIIFAIRFKDGEATNWAGPFIYYGNIFEGQRYGRDGKLMQDTLDLKGTVGQFLHEYKKALWDSYDDEDMRRDATFMDHYGSAQKEGFGIAMKKGIGSVNSNNQRIFDTDIIVYRYADVLLMMAEIENALSGKCANYVNEVRKRAYGKNWHPQFAYTDGSYADNELTILHERDKEFVWEGKRWFDVVRMHDANGKSLAFSVAANYPNNETPDERVPLIKESEAHKLLWPIDVNTLNNDPKLEQTPGYDK